ncbi:hypothetical protein MCC93_20850 [Morococcus cerebrosus]|uniref:Uncharacterized protein n=1 Tax=Morococcus cerebrosus TaxID=1056807 RepID=A0A0C1E3Q8_9NEIS|nr:hypothetical protein MCC93_20850 [Morococcus cerebrosus]
MWLNLICKAQSLKKSSENQKLGFQTTFLNSWLYWCVRV